MLNDSHLKVLNFNILFKIIKKTWFFLLQKKVTLVTFPFKDLVKKKVIRHNLIANNYMMIHLLNFIKGKMFSSIYKL